MKKKLLFVAFALMTASSLFAFNEGDYVYTKNDSLPRVKVTGSNLVENSTFANGDKSGYTDAEGTAFDFGTNWSPTPGVGPNVENPEDVIESIAYGESAPLVGRWQIDEGATYMISFSVKATGPVTTQITDAAANNYFDVFVNSDGSRTKVASTEEAPVISVAKSVTLTADWQTIAFVVPYIDANQYVVFHMNKMMTGVQVTNVAVQKCQSVYDVRILERKMDYYQKLLDEPLFNVDAAQTQRGKLQNMITRIQQMMNTPGQLDVAATGEAAVTQFDKLATEYLDASTTRMNKYLPGTDDLPSLPTVGRGGARGTQFSSLDLWGGNWGHTGGADCMMSAIQTGYGNYTATYRTVNSEFPAGKYFFTGEIRNANTGRTSWPCEPVFNVSTMCKMFVGADTIEVGPVAGEDYQRFFMIGDTETANFFAGFFWPGTDNGGAFFVRNVEVRAFNTGDIDAQIEHVQAWKTFKKQWDAAVSSQRGAWNLVKNGNYPWGQDSLQSAFNIWDPYFNEYKAKGWVAEDGTDTGVATTEELTDWAKYNGVEMYSEPDSLGETKRLEYQVVRGYQYTVSYVKNLNKPFTDFAEAIDAAKKIRNMGANLTGDRAAYKTAIVTAIDLLIDVRKNTTDATRVNDSTALADGLAALNDATATFLASVSNKPVVDIDFANNFELIGGEGDDAEDYVIKGVAGEMKFPGASVDLEHGDGTGTPKYGYHWSLGFGDDIHDVLHIGSTNAVVALPEVADNEAVRITFDFWGGYLNKCFTKFALQNAAGEEIAQITRYNSQGTSSSTFGWEAGDIDKYITVQGSGKQNNVEIYNGKNNKTSVDIVIDYTKKTQQLTITNEGAGTKEGAAVDIVAPASEDIKVAKFVVTSNYSSQNNSSRRSWFDNLKISKYALEDVEEDITQSPWADTTGIQTVEKKTVNNGVIYTLSGIRVEKAAKPGLYIKNGKKIVIK